ncbi:MAG: hypothetical protein ACWGQW_16460, partial [bacterium]
MAKQGDESSDRVGILSSQGGSRKKEFEAGCACPPEGHRTPFERMFCCREGVVGAAIQELATQNQFLLRTRLLAISALSLLGHSLFFV